MPPPDSGVVGDHTCRSGQQQGQQGEAQQLAAQGDTTGAAAIAVGPPTTICAEEEEDLGLAWSTLMVWSEEHALQQVTNTLREATTPTPTAGYQ